MTVKTFTVGNMDNKCYLVTDDVSGESALVDASFAHKSFVDEISSLKDNLKYIFHNCTLWYLLVNSLPSRILYQTLILINLALWDRP